MGEVLDLQGTKIPLSARTRAGLDLARALAAVYVVAHHTIHLPAPFGSLFSFGQEAVLVFFLLSGFVIFANERDRAAHPRGYYLRRFRRIYPPLIFAMLVSTVLWAVGAINAVPTWESAVGTLLSLQDISALKPGVLVSPYLGNSPLWSLSYEVAFYAVFPLVMVAWRRSPGLTRRLVPLLCGAGLVTYLAVPNHFSIVAAYFMMWWAGAMAAHLYGRSEMHFKRATPEIVGLATLVGIAAIGVVIYGNPGLGLFPFLLVRHFLFATVLFMVLLSPLRTHLAALSFKGARPAAAVAAISYGLYVLHYPLLAQTGADQSLWFIPLMAVTVGLAWIADVGLAKVIPRAPRN